MMLIRYLSAGAAILPLLAAGSNTDTPARKPNILFIAFDDLRPELGCYGVKNIQTPNLDRLARQGVMFTRAYCQDAVSAPSRASIMTGYRPDSSLVWTLREKFRIQRPDVVTMPQYFRKFGYHTVSIGKIFHNHMPDSVSFDEPDLRPAPYKTAEMVDRDAESFYYDEGINKELDSVHLARLAKNPKAYAGGWAYGRATEIADCQDDELYDGAQTDLALETLKRLKDRDEPFYLALGYFRPHLPFVAPRKYWELYDRNTIPMAPNPYHPKNSPPMAPGGTYELGGCYDLEGRVDINAEKQPDDIARLLKHGYYASVSYVDACFGKLMKGLEELGLADNTIIVIWGDHGWKLGENGGWCKQTNYQIDTRVPLIIRAPGMQGNGKECDRLAELVDLYPTLCDLAGLPAKSDLQGTSLVPLLKNPAIKWKDHTFSQFQHALGKGRTRTWYMGYSMTTERYHIVEWYVWDDINKERKEFAAREFYDLQEDPQENVNVAGEPQYKNLVASLSEKLNTEWDRNSPPVR
jgi:iduronate 2-sulfatase